MQSKRRILSAAVVVMAFTACVDNAYDLGNISLKMTLGPNGVTLPLGTFDKTVDSLVADNDIKDLVSDDGYYAYKRDSVIKETIDAIVIDPIRDVIPAIDPYDFRLTDAALPETFDAEGFNSNTTVVLPSFDLGDQSFEGVSISKPIDIDNLVGMPISPGTEVPLPELDETDNFAFSLANIAEEVASVNRIYFSGTALGTPIRVKFSLGALSTAVNQGQMSLSLRFPTNYALKLDSNYGGTARVNGSTLTVTNYPVPASGADMVFYIAEREVTEPISAGQTLDIDDVITYTFDYTGVSNGTTIESGNAPLFSLAIAPAVNDAIIVTNDITLDPATTATDLTFEIADLKGISRVDYIAFTSSSSNALILRAAHPPIPLRGNIPVMITFPEVFDFVAGIVGMSGNVLTTTLDEISTRNGMALPLKGIRLEGNDAVVTNGVLTIQKEVVSVVSPYFPSNTYKTSELNTTENIDININVNDVTFYIDAGHCQMVAGFSEPIDITQTIDETFDVPDEVSGITFAQVLDANNGNEAQLIINLAVENSPVNRFYFDDIEIVLPSFLQVEHPNLDEATNTVRINRMEYKGRPITIARIAIKGIKDVPIRKTSSGKLAKLEGEVHLKTTVNVPDGTQIDGADQNITLLPNVVVSPLRVSHVTGSVDIDLQQYLKPTTIDLSDIRESLGNQNIEVNLVAPQIRLEASNPIGVGMMGDIILQAYDFENKKLNPVVVKNIYLEPADDNGPRITKLYVSDATKAPAGYTLCRVEDLANIVKIIPSKIDITFDMQVDDSRQQSFVITGKDYAFDVDYEIKLPLRFKDDAVINYTDVADLDKDAFDDIDKYEITAEDIVIMLDTKTTLPMDLNLSVEMLDIDGVVVDDVTTEISGPVKGYNAATDGDYKQTSLAVRVMITDGDIRRLKPIAKVRYTFQGQAVGTGAELRPRQYITAKMKLVLKKGITIDLDNL